MSERDYEKDRKQQKLKNGEEPEKRRGLVIIYQIITLLLCLAISCIIWLAVHFNETNKQPDKNENSTVSAYSLYGFNSDL